MIQIALIDHYDSFTYNIVHYLKDFDIAVFYPNQIDETYLQKASHIILSPGYGHPKDAKETLSVLQRFYQQKKILGICLGHQIIAYYFNSKIRKLKNPCHGKTFLATHQDGILFKDVPKNFKIGRYHSLCVAQLNKVLRANCFSDDGVLMGFEHTKLPIFGLQFHPESILSDFGKKILLNFLHF